MRIGEISELTGLSISNIRFYEKKGLIEPAREKESKYREYTEADLLCLKQITLYRKMNLSIETISMIIQEKLTLEEAVANQLKELEKQKEMLEGSISLCQKVLEKGDIKEEEVDYYLNYVREEEAKGTRFAELDEFLGDFADFIQITKFIGDPYVGRFLINPTIFRAITMIVFLWLIALPIIMILDCYKDHGVAHGKKFIFACVWLLVVFGSFIHFRIKMRHKRKKDE